MNIFSLPEVSLPALRIADSVRLRSVCVNRDSKGELSLVGRVGPSAVGGSIQLLLAEVLRVGAFPWSVYPTSPCFDSFLSNVPVALSAASPKSVVNPQTFSISVSDPPRERFPITGALRKRPASMFFRAAFFAVAPRPSALPSPSSTPLQPAADKDKAPVINLTASSPRAPKESQSKTGNQPRK